MKPTPLNYEEFEKYLIREETLWSGFHYVFKFENGYGASVVKHSFSYGNEEDLFELAVLDDKGELCYSTPITNDVIGYLSNDDVIKLLNEIKNL